jgi:DNA invertase Pin-like site-specific DNA recombinase
MATLTEWLKLMLAEIARKQEDAARAAAEQKARQAGQKSTTSPAG